MATRIFARSLLTTKQTLSSVLSRPYTSLCLSTPPSSLVRVRLLVAFAANFHRPSPAATTIRSFSSRPTSSSLRDQNPNLSNRPPKETILLEGCDFEHWLVVMEKPEGDPTRDEIIDSYIKTLATVVGSEEEARMKIYSVSTRCYFAFGALVSEELSYKIKELPRVRWVLPDSYLDVRNKDYGGEPFINGQAVPYDPKYHEEWVRNNARANDRNRRNNDRDRPRNFDRSRNFERRRDNMQNRDFQMANQDVQSPGSNTGGMPPSNMGGQPNMGQMPPRNMGGQPNMGGMPSNNMGGMPQNNMGGMPPNNVGGMPQNMGGMPPNNVGGMPQNNMGGMPQNNMGGMPPNNMGGMPPNNVGGMPQNNMGGIPQNNMGGMPPNNVGGMLQNMGGMPQNNMGGMPQNNMGGMPQNNVGRMPPNNMGGAPNMGGVPSNMGGMPNNAPNFQYGGGPSNGGMPFQNRDMSGPGRNNAEYQHDYAPNTVGGNPYQNQNQNQNIPGRDMPPLPKYQ